MHKLHPAVFLLLLFPLGLSAQWTKLFDGKSLKGWHQLGGQALYTVEKGQIVGTCVAQTPNSFLCTDAEYGDFILELELRVHEKMNSGIQFRSLSKPEYQNGRVHGYQMEIDPSPRAWSGGIYDEARRDWLYIPNLNPAGKRAFRNGQWNHYRIEAIGNTLRTWVNGVPVAHLIDDLTPRGFIALQIHAIYGEMQPGMQIRWRNIRIQTRNLEPRPWDDTPVVNLLQNQLSAQEKAQGFELLFNGNDLSGWQDRRKGEMPGKHWSVQQGDLCCAASDSTQPRSDLFSARTFAAFELLFDFQLSEGANSGLKYFVDENLEPGKGFGVGLEYQLLDDARHPDAKQGAAGNRTLASLYDLIPAEKPEKRFLRKPGEWQQARIQVYPDGRVRHWLNGFMVLEYRRKSALFQALVARSKYAHYPDFGMNTAGPILLQDHGDAVRFRNLKWRELHFSMPENCEGQ